MIIDKTLYSGRPGISTSTLRLKRDDMLKYVRAVGHEPTFIDLPTE